jgi:hypothetical protein
VIAEAQDHRAGPRRPVEMFALPMASFVGVVGTKLTSQEPLASSITALVAGQDELPLQGST